MMTTSRIPLLALALALLTACGQTASTSLPEPSVLPTVEGDVQADSPIGDENFSPVSPEDYDELIGQAVLYLPVYSGQARGVSGLENHEELATTDFEMWKKVYGGNESLQPGQFSSSDSLARSSEDPTISDDQAAATKDEVVDYMEDIGIDYEQLVAGRTFMPLFIDLAEVCGSPSAVGIYATGSESPPAVLEQYQGVEPVAAKMPEGILRAWQFAVNSSISYLIQHTTTPEVVLIVGVSDSGCSLEEVASQVSVERRVAD